MSESASKTESGVSLADVRRVAELASLELTEAEQQRMVKDLNAILGHIAELGEVDTSAVEPMAAGIPSLLGIRKMRCGGMCGGPRWIERW